MTKEMYKSIYEGAIVLIVASIAALIIDYVKELSLVYPIIVLVASTALFVVFLVLYLKCKDDKK